MPIVTRPVNPLGTDLLGRQGLDMTRTAPINLDKDWQEIQNMIQAGIIPSSLRIKEYL